MNSFVCGLFVQLRDSSSQVHNDPHEFFMKLMDLGTLLPGLNIFQGEEEKQVRSFVCRSVRPPPMDL
jgi:hypothetical protein